MKKKVLEERYVSNRNQLHALFLNGEKIWRHGGIFEVVPSDKYGIESLHFQPSLMRRYAMVYGSNDLKMVNGTHHLSKHKMIPIVWSIVDGLQRTKIAGLSYCPSENHAPIIQGAKYFFLGEGVRDREEKTITLGKFSGYFDPYLHAEVSLQCNRKSPEDIAEHSQVDVPIDVSESH